MARTWQVVLSPKVQSYRDQLALRGQFPSATQLDQVPRFPKTSDLPCMHRRQAHHLPQLHTACRLAHTLVSVTMPNSPSLVSAPCRHRLFVLLLTADLDIVRAKGTDSCCCCSSFLASSLLTLDRQRLTMIAVVMRRWDTIAVVVAADCYSPPMLVKVVRWPDSCPAN